MITSIGKELARAQSGGYALPLFDTFDMHGTDGMFAALEERRAPAMIALYASTMDRSNARALCRTGKSSMRVVTM